jgi:lytic murein transglycosylase
VRLANFFCIMAALISCAQGASEFSGCVAALKRDAINAGIGKELASRALDDVLVNETVLRLSKAQPEFRMPIWDYFAFLIDDLRVIEGRLMLDRHLDVLTKAEREFGVSRHVLAAIWGVETDYGRQTGEFFLPEALANMACTGASRRSFWRNELLSALRLVARGDLRLDELYGSWAGAFGQTQFIPSTYERLAVDFDGDNRRDLVNSVADALASTANYLKRAGWRANAPWIMEVQVPPNFDAPSGRKNRASLSFWARRGVKRVDGGPLSGEGNASLLLPAGNKGPGFLVFPNFDAIYSYNQAESYALAISYLASRLAGLAELATAWPTDDPGLSRAERLHLQQLLLATGYYTGETDGKIGPITRAAIAAAEKDLGLQQTGRAGRKIYHALLSQVASKEPLRSIPDWEYYDDLFGPLARP